MGALGGYLKARDLGIRALDILLFHHRRSPTRIPLKFLDPTANMSHLLMVANERLGVLELEASVIRLSLESAELARLQQVARDLFQKDPVQGNSIQLVLDKLTARLGDDSLYAHCPAI